MKKRSPWDIDKKPLNPFVREEQTLRGEPTLKFQTYDVAVCVGGIGLTLLVIAKMLLSDRRFNRKMNAEAERLAEEAKKNGEM